jgi:hypothetical protein
VEAIGIERRVGLHEESADESPTKANLLRRTEEEVLEYPSCPSSLVVEKVFKEATNAEVFEFQASEQEV